MTQTAQALISEAASGLSQVSGSDARTEARILLAHVLGISRTAVSVMRDESISEDNVKTFRGLVTKRADHHPISHLTHTREFWGRDFLVTPDVLDPRPDTETLIELALQGAPVDRVLDLGTGSGCILLTLLAEWDGASGVGVDASQKALEVAKQNANQLGLSRKAEWVRCDWFEGIKDQFPLIVSNPPYISEAEFQALDQGVRKWEPKQALVPDEDGLGAYRKIAQAAKQYLTADGRLLLEIGWKQGKIVQQLFEKQGFYAVTIHQDIDGRDRVVQVLV